MQWSTGDRWLIQSIDAGGRWLCCGQDAGLHCWLIVVIEAGTSCLPLLRRFDYRDAPDALGPVGNFLMAALLIFLCGASVFFTVGRQFQVRRYLACTLLPMRLPVVRLWNVRRWHALHAPVHHPRLACVDGVLAFTATSLHCLLCRPTWCP